MRLFRFCTAAPLMGAAAIAAAQVSFAGPTQFATGERPAGIASGDFDNDGDFDFAVAVDNPDRISVYFNDGSGGFGVPVNYQTGSNTGPDALIATDLDGDTDLDLAVTLHNVNQARTYINQGNGAFALGTTVNVGANPIDIVAGNFGGTSAVDLATCNRDGNSVSVLIASGAGFTVSSVATQLEPREIAAADFDADGDDDIFATNHDSRSISFLQNNAGVFTNAQSYGVNPSTRPEGIAAADLDSDGDIDLGVALSDDNISFLAVFLNNGNGTLAPAINYNTGGMDTDSVAFGDFDFDGDQDAALSNNGNNTASFMANNGSGGFGAAIVMATGTYPEWVQVLDMDSDGSLDVAISNRDSNNLSFYINNNANAGAAPSSLNIATGSIVSGNLASLFASDDNRLVMHPGIVLSTAQPPLVLELETKAAGGTASAIRFTVESASTSSSINQRISLFNFRTQTWDVVNSRAMAISDTTVEIDVTLEAADYVDPSTNAMRARLAWRPTAPLLAFPWNARVDMVRWVITP